jgi:diguanylate cyclase (GGDEF)-like protein
MAAMDKINFRDVYEHSPVSLWIEDYSAIRRQLEELRAQGVTDFSAYLDGHPQVVESCMAAIEVLDVNDYTLRLFRAPSREALLANLHRVFRDDMRSHFRKELEDMWLGRLDMSIEGVNFALDGTPIYIHLTRRALPGHEADWSRILLSLTDVTSRKFALDRLAENQLYSEGLFEHSPVSLWVEDYSAIKAWLDDLRRQGISNFSRHLADNPDVVTDSLKLIRVQDVNQNTLALYRAQSKEHLLANLDRVFRDGMRVHWERELVDMWNGRLESEYEGVNYTLEGEAIDIVMRTRPMPGSEDSWERVLIAISDVTARKKAEAYLGYLGTHDVLTGLRNRTYFDDARNTLQKEGRFPVSIIIIDLNGLKVANDSGGHEAGDLLLRRAAEVLTKAAGPNDIAARLGGDEFAILMPFQDERAARNTVAAMHSLLDMNNQFYGGQRLSFALGCATAYSGMTVSDAMRMADQRMYAAKREHYQGGSVKDRRKGEALPPQLLAR